jgi:hypothetical protein
MLSFKLLKATIIKTMRWAGRKMPDFSNYGTSCKSVMRCSTYNISEQSAGRGAATEFSEIEYAPPLI